MLQEGGGGDVMEEVELILVILGVGIIGVAALYFYRKYMYGF